jgi:hypothetical protein
LFPSLKFSFRIRGFERFVFNVFLQTTETGRSAIVSEVLSFPPAEDIKKSAETGKTLGRRLQRAEKAFFIFIHKTRRSTFPPMSSHPKYTAVFPESLF